MTKSEKGKPNPLFVIWNSGLIRHSSFVIRISSKKPDASAMLHYSNYWVLDHGNFGDDLNPWLWSRLAPEGCEQSDPAVFFGIGTILSRSAPPVPNKVVFGSGCGTGLGPKLDNRWFFYAVRGPLTAAKLGLDAALALGDPSILARRTELTTHPK